MGVLKTSAPLSVSSGPITGGAVFGQPRSGLASPRPSVLNRRVGMGMKLSGISTTENKSSLNGLFGNDFQKWSEIMYLQPDFR